MKKIKSKYINEYNDFWECFSKNESLFIKELSWNNIDESLFIEKYNECSDIIENINENLSFEIKWSDNNWKFQVIITANGILSVFKYVEEIVENSILLKNWEVIKFRQPQDWIWNKFNYEWKNYLVDDFNFSLDYLSDKEDNRFIWLRIFIKDFNKYSKEDKEDFKTVSLTIIDHILWEYTFAEYIQWPIDFMELPKNDNSIHKLNNIYALKWLMEDFLEKKEYLNKLK